MMTERTLEIDGRILSCYLSEPMDHRSTASGYWVMRIGLCDVGTDIRADTETPWEELRRELIAWYRRKQRVFSRCWEESTEPSEPEHQSHDERHPLREPSSTVRAKAQVAARRCAELAMQHASRVSHVDGQSTAFETTMAELRMRMSQFGELLRALDTSPQRAIFQLSSAINEVVPPREDDTRRVREDALRWGILGYYGESDAA